MENPEYVFNPRPGVDLPFESVKLPFGYLTGRMVLIRIKKDMNPVNILDRLEIGEKITKTSVPDLRNVVPSLLINRRSAAIHIPDFSCSAEAFNRLRDDAVSLSWLCRKDHKTLYIVAPLEDYRFDPYTRRYDQIKDLDLQMQTDIILDIIDKDVIRVIKNRLQFETTQRTFYSEPKS